MKSTAITLAVLLVAVFVGACRDNGITVPVDTPEPAIGQLPKTKSGILSLGTIVRCPGVSFNCFIRISGEISYAATLMPLDPEPPNPQFAVELTTLTNAKLAPFESSTSQWFVSGSLENDLVPIPYYSGEALLHKRFPVKGRDDGLMLCVKIRITTTTVALGEIWLELPTRASDLVRQ
jgi:hypothetical protein